MERAISKCDEHFDCYIVVSCDLLCGYVYDFLVEFQVDVEPDAFKVVVLGPEEGIVQGHDVVAVLCHVEIVRRYKHKAEVGVWIYIEEVVGRREFLEVV